MKFALIFNQSHFNNQLFHPILSLNNHPKLYTPEQVPSTA